MLAALRANSRKSTGPRTARGKARSCLNALKHGRYARHLPQKLVQAGYHRDAALIERLQEEIAATFGVTCPEERGQTEQLAAGAWCLARRVEDLERKLECLLGSEGRWSKVQPEQGFGAQDCEEAAQARTALDPAVRVHFRIVNRLWRLGLVFWMQRRRHWTAKRVVNVRVGLEPWTAPSGRREERWRRKRFRSRKLGVCERAELEKQARRRVAWQ